jgi:hypothetical protein
VLCLEVSVKPNEQHHDAYGNECCTEGLAKVAEAGLWAICRRLGVVMGRERRVEAEELCYGYAD